MNGCFVINSNIPVNHLTYTSDSNEIRGDYCLFASTLLNGQLEKTGTISIEYSTFALPFLKNIRLPCLLALSKRKEMHYLLMHEPLFLWEGEIPTESTSEKAAVSSLQQTAYYNSNSTTE